MNHYDIQKRILDVFAECSVFSFPVDCTSLLEHYGYTLHTYQELGRKNKALYEMCISYSEEAFRGGAHRIIAYNQDKSPLRIRFSLAHELGHHILGHKNETRHNEIEANFFAGNLLAPRMAIYYARCQNARDVSFIFQISEEAAQIAYEDYLRWHEELLLRERRMTALERDMYYHFYRAEQDCFVWNVKTCDFCGATLYNSYENHCRGCELPKERPLRSDTPALSDILFSDDMERFRRMEARWLSPIL